MRRIHAHARLFIALALLSASRIPAQTFVDLYDLNPGLGGANPEGEVLASGTNIFGTAFNSGAYGDGSVFVVSADGSTWADLHDFNYSVDGANPQGNLVLSGNTLYGTTSTGGINGYGTVYSVNIDGSGFSNLYSFSGNDGANPQAGLVLSGGTLYGTTYNGGNNNWGAVFAINTDGTGFTDLYSFSYSDGGNPEAPLALSCGNLYGTTTEGGAYGEGLVFTVNTNGTSYADLHDFESSDGSDPQAGVFISGNTLFGSTYYGGVDNAGTLFSVNNDGTGFTNLLNFTYTNGQNPIGALILLGTNLYGATTSGGDDGVGILFSIGTNGAGFSNLMSFNYGGGYNPQAGLSADGLTIYGTTYYGGAYYGGTVFALLIPCQTITLGPDSLPDALVNGSYNQTITATGGFSPYEFTLAGGSLPPGITLSTNGELSGLTRVTGTYSFSVIVTDMGGCAATNDFTFNVDPSPLAELYSFPPASGPDGTNVGGIFPNNVIVSGNILYGTAPYGGANGSGTVFAVNTDGSGFVTLHDFTASSTNAYGADTNSDGVYPSHGLVQGGNTLYGTTPFGGTAGAGTLFAVNTDGSGFQTLYTFTDGDDGGYPECNLILLGNTLYGTTSTGGINGYGTVFAVNTDGTGFTTLYSFGRVDGGVPSAGLTSCGNTLYGTTSYGGNNGTGTIFTINTDGSGFNSLYSFSYPVETMDYQQTNGDGLYPSSDLVLSGDTLYGTANQGGPGGDGTIFSITTNGAVFTTLYSFTATDPNTGENLDGADPGGLTLSGNTLYGTASDGGFYDFGTAFSIHTDGSDFTTMVDFEPPDGNNPTGPMAYADNTLYGTAYGGYSGYGLIFTISTCPYITVGPDALPAGYLGQSYNQLLTATGGVVPYTFTVSDGSLPGGLSLSSGGVLSGSPTNFGTFNCTVLCADSNGCTATLPCSLQIFADFAALHSFDSTNGANPSGGLVLSDETLYGLTSTGGVYQSGTIYAVNTDGSGFGLLHTFIDSSYDGIDPRGSLILSGNNLYGVTQFGGEAESGTLFTINTYGTGYSNLYNFGTVDIGYEPQGTLLLANNLLYGASDGGSAYSGTLFQIGTSGAGATALYTFAGGASGGAPQPNLIQSGSTLFGMAGGGSSGYGILYSVGINGSGYTILHTFTDSSTDGGYPVGGLILAGDTLYGSANYGGVNNVGVIFSINTNGANFAILHSFAAWGIRTVNNEEYLTNSDGAYPSGALVLAGNTLYGTASTGGPLGYGTAFAINTNGAGFALLYAFTNGADGAFPNAPLIFVGSTLYGTTQSGGIYSNGTVFSIGLDESNNATAPTITWTNPSPITYGAALTASQLNATANVPGSFSYDPIPGTVLGSIGTYTLSAVFTPSDTFDYAIATNTVNIMVTPATLTVTANNTNRLQGSPNPAFSGIITGLTNGDNITATYSCSATHSSPPGTYSIIPALVDPSFRATNYTVNLVDGTLTVIPIAATFNSVYAFSALSGRTNADGDEPEAGLILVGNTLYGVTAGGGANGTGTVYAIHTDGTQFKDVYNFSYVSGCCGFYENNDGDNPEGTLVLANNTLYGSAIYGGTGYVGTLFSVQTNGSGFDTLHDFQNVFINSQNFPENADGSNPYAGMVLSNGVLYGTTIYGGSYGGGTVFSVNSDGSDFVSLHDFQDASTTTGTNADGLAVFAGLVLAGDTLYGSSQAGGTNGGGTVFALQVNGAGFTVLHHFLSTTDGSEPDGLLLLVGSNLFGVTGAGGSGGEGTVFTLYTNGSGFTVLHNFPPLNNDTNTDGAAPLGGLALSSDGAMLFGTATMGGTWGHGSVFAIGLDGAGFTNLYNFTGGADGSYPASTPVVAGDTLYGTAGFGGPSDSGVIYSLTALPPRLSISLLPGFNQLNFSQPSVLVTWPASDEGFTYAGYTLEATTNLSSGSWTNVAATPFTSGGQIEVDVPLSYQEQFFRLYQSANP